MKRRVSDIAVMILSFLVLLAGVEVSVISLIGFVMLVGVIVNNGIVLVDYINQLRLEGMGRR